MPNATILVTVTPEPPAYHEIKDEQTRVYAVHLAFGGDRDAVSKLLNNGEWRFNAYQLNGTLAADIDRLGFPVPGDMRVQGWV